MSNTFAIQPDKFVFFFCTKQITILGEEFKILDHVKQTSCCNRKYHFTRTIYVCLSLFSATARMYPKCEKSAVTHILFLRSLHKEGERGHYCSGQSLGIRREPILVLFILDAQMPWQPKRSGDWKLIPFSPNK